MSRNNGDGVLRMKPGENGAGILKVPKLRIIQAIDKASIIVRLFPLGWPDPSYESRLVINSYD